jgi:alkylation response protein AidB-like acyl-CoA dehydrogenase
MVEVEVVDHLTDPARAEPDAVRREVRAWVRDIWDPDRSLRAWRELLAHSGWAAPSWPRRWHGRGLPAWADGIAAEELRTAGAVGTPIGSGMGLAAPTILAEGPDLLRERYLWPILTGEETWCQLFSEPDAGSDLAGLTTRAVLDGDEWVVNGQKVWNTSAQHADLGLLLARSDGDVPKHRGITYLVLPMHQAGVVVHPLRQMNDHSSFNQVFLTDVRIPRDQVIGTVGGGWHAALTTLAFERRFGAMTKPTYAPDAGRALEEARREADDHFETYRWYPQRAGRVDLIVPQAHDTGTAGDPLVRQQVAGVLALHRSSGWTAERARAALALGRTPGPEGSIGKLATSAVATRAAATHTAMVGAAGMLTGPDSPRGGVIAEILVSTPAQSIAGGTDEIQHNILGERALGLPREPAPDRDLPFNRSKSPG